MCGRSYTVDEALQRLPELDRELFQEPAYPSNPVYASFRNVKPGTIFPVVERAAITYGRGSMYHANVLGRVGEDLVLEESFETTSGAVQQIVLRSTSYRVWGGTHVIDYKLLVEYPKPGAPL